MEGKGGYQYIIIIIILMGGLHCPRRAAWSYATGCAASLPSLTWTCPATTSADLEAWLCDTYYKTTPGLLRSTLMGYTCSGTCILLGLLSLWGPHGHTLLSLPLTGPPTYPHPHPHTQRNYSRDHHSDLGPALCEDGVPIFEVRTGWETGIQAARRP